MKKSEINKVLKSIGFGFVKMNVNMHQDKTHPSKTKGLRGGSIGPMTMTNAYTKHNSDTIDKVKSTLTNIGGNIENTECDLSISFPSIKGKLIYHFNLSLFPTYAHNEYDKGYQTYWLTLYKSETV